MTWRPPKALGLCVGLVFVLTLAAVDFYLIRSMQGQPIGLNLFFMALLFTVSLPLFALWVYWYLGLITLRYQLDRNGLVITSLGYRYTIPMGAIREVRSGADVAVAQGFRGIGWPGYLKGSMRLAKLGTVLIHSTQPLHRQLLVVTDMGCHGISPARSEAFRQDFERRSTLGPMRELSAEELHLNLAGLAVWQDRVFWAIIALAALVDLLSFGWMAARYAGLPQSIPLHVVGSGEVARIASKASLLIVPALGSMATLVNGLLGFALHSRERVGAYLLLIAVVLVHLVTVLALFRVLG